MIQPVLASAFCFLITFQLFFVGIFLVTHKKGNHRNNILLGVIFFLLSWNMGDLTLRMNDILLKWEFIQLLDDGLILLYGPLIYFYSKGVIFRDFKLSTQHLIHLIPYGLICIVILYPTGLQPGTIEDFVERSLPWQFYLISALMYAHFFVYLGLSYQTLRSYRQVIKNKFSRIDQINLDWLNFMLSTFGLITIVSLIHNFMTLANNTYAFMASLVLLLIFIFFFVIRVILKALRQPEIFAGISQNEVVKYLGSSLTKSQVEDHKNRLIALFSTKKPYLNPQLSLNDLAEELSVPSKHLSQVINQSFHKSFFDFVNSYRVKEFQQILRDSNDDQLTVLEVMYEVGFNSKSSFNTAFKKETGKTPSQFRKSIGKIGSTS